MTNRERHRDEAAHAVTDDGGVRNACRFEHAVHPVREFFDAIQCGSVGAAVAGKIGRDHAHAVAREVARRHHPDRVIVRGAVNEHHRRRVGSRMALPVPMNTERPSTAMRMLKPPRVARA